MKLLKSSCTKSKASVVDGKLILSLPAALDPVVWQMNLSEAKASALEVTSQDEKSTLTLKTPKGESIIVASFQNRDTAIKSLMAAAKALENAAGKITPNTLDVGKPVHNYQTKNSSWLKKILTGIGVLATIFVLYSIIIMVTGFGMPGPKTASAPSNPPASSGVPMSADDFLRGR